MSEQKTIYAPAIWVRERTNRFGETELRVSVGEEFCAWAAEHRDDKGYTKLLIRKKRDTSDPVKPTHHVQLDTWRPTERDGQGRVTSPGRYPSRDTQPTRYERGQQAARAFDRPEDDLGPIGPDDIPFAWLLPLVLPLLTGVLS